MEILSLTIYPIQHVVEIFGLVPLPSGGFKKTGLAENSSLVSKLSVIINLDQYIHWNLSITDTLATT